VIVIIYGNMQCIKHFELSTVITFYTLYFTVQQRSREHFNLLILLSCNFDNFVTLAK